MDDTDTERRDAERHLLTAALRETTGAIIVTAAGFEALAGLAPADSLAGLDWRDYESAVRRPDGGGR